MPQMLNMGMAKKIISITVIIGGLALIKLLSLPPSNTRGIRFMYDSIGNPKADGVEQITKQQL
ncbi:MAG: hypothetical protein RRY13_08630, partial [Akkermansia sp.]